MSQARTDRERTGEEPRRNNVDENQSAISPVKETYIPSPDTTPVDRELNNISPTTLMMMDDCSAFLADADLDFTSSLPGQYSRSQVFPLANVNTTDIGLGYNNDPHEISRIHGVSLPDMMNNRQSSGNQSYSTAAQSTWQDSSPVAQSGSECLCNPSCTSRVSWVATICRRNLDPTTLRKVTDADVYSTPPPETIDCLLRYFFMFKHFRLPIVSEWDVYCLIHSYPVVNNEMARPLSLALFYAIMFSGSGMATKEEASRAGFPSVRAMRHAFYTGAKVCF